MEDIAGLAVKCVLPQKKYRSVGVQNEDFLKSHVFKKTISCLNNMYEAKNSGTWSRLGKS